MIYICVPARDEGQTVGVVLWKVRQVMAEADRDYQILVADDGSTDKTPEVLEPYTRVLPLTVLRSERARGYAASLEMLLREAVHRSEYPRRDVIVVLQADFTEEPEHILSLLKRIESGADVVVSNPAGGVRVTVRERLTGWVERLLMRGRLPAEVRDPLAGYHAYRVSAVRRAFEKDTHARLLPWKDRAANAALLEAVAPHARRVDAVEWTGHPERRQRASRVEPGSHLKEVWAFARNRMPPDLIPVAGLAPDSVRTARTSEHAVTVEALRSAGVTRAGEEERPRRRRSGNTGNGRTRAGVKDGRRTRSGESSEGSKAADAPRKRKRRKPRAPGETGPTAGEDVQAGTPEAENEAAPPKRRRSRRGRRRTSGNAEGGEADVGASSGPAAEAAGDEASSDESGEARPSRRRRGRRGGRRRSGRPQSGGEDAQPGDDSPASSPGDG